MTSKDNKYQDKILRTFSNRSDDDIWRKEKEDIIIKIINGYDWKLQYYNKDPIDLNKDKKYFIGKNQAYRLIKGRTNLNIEIKELKNVHL